ncbi:MAG: hypothetical protein EOM04_08235, partial [Clostridia bacterium]|nr:hypothetical protein [Clostridia bacterium]
MEEKLIQWLQERHPETDDTRGLSGVNTIDPALNIKQEREQASNYAIEASGSIYTLPGAVKSRFDRSKNPEDYRTVEALNKQRAREQTAVGKAFNAIWGGVASGLVTAAEDIYHIGNSLANAESFAKAELREKDAVLEFLGKTKEGIYNALPIYEMEKETALGEFFKWNSLRGMLDSIVGFALPGFGIGSGIKGLANLALRSARLEAYGTKLVQGATTFTSAYLMNLGETGIMNMELGELAFQNEIGRRAGLILADKYNNDPRFARLAEVEATEEVENDNEFKAAVGQQQKDFALLNKAMIASDAFAIAGLFRLKGATRNIVKPAGVKKAFQEFLKTNPTGLNKAAFVGKYLVSPSNPIAQNLKEAAEEMYQNAIQEQGLFELRRDSGDLTEEEELFVVPKTNVGRLLKFGTSKQAVVEGLMGFFSGGLQRTMMQKAQDLATGDRTGTNRKTRINDLYDKQQEFDQVVKSKQAELLGYEIERAAAEASGDDIAVEHLEEAFFLSKAQEAIDLGTIDMLYRNLEGIAKLTNEQAKELKLRDDYKQRAEDRIKELTKLEKTYLNINSKWANRKLTASEIFAKTLEVEHRGKVNTKYTQKLNTLYDEIAEDLRQIYGEVVPEDIIDILKSGDISSLNSSIQISLAANEKYDAIHDVKSKIKINQDLAEEATARLNQITSPEFTPEVEQAEIEAVRKKFYTIADVLADKKLPFVYNDADKDMTLLVVKENDDYILHVVNAETGISEPLLNKKNEPIKFLGNIEEFAKNSNLQDVIQQAALEDLDLEKLIEDFENKQKSAEQSSSAADQVESSSPTIANIKVGDTYVLDNKEVEVVEVKDNSVKLKDDKGSITTLNSDELTKLSIPKKADDETTSTPQSGGEPSLFDDAAFENTGVPEITEQKVVNSSKVSDHLAEESVDDLNEPAKRTAITYFFGTQGNIKAGQDLSSTPATRRWYDFVNAHSFGKGSDIRGKLVPLTESDINSLPPSYRKTYKDKQGKDQYYPQYRIFIVNSKGEYAHRNEKGEFVYKKSLDMNTAVFTFTAYLGHTFQDLQNSPMPRLRASVTEEEFNQAKAAYIKFIKTTMSKNKGYINFIGKSVGIWNARTYGDKQAQPLQPVKAIQPDTKKVDIGVSIGGSVTFNLGNNQTKEVTAKRGSIVIFNRETGEASFGYSKPISKEHREIILEFFRQLAGMVNSDGTIVNAPQGMWKMLATLTNYTKNNLRSNGTEIYTNANNKFHFITKNGKL